MKDLDLDERLREAALEEQCDECAAQPGQMCRRTRNQGFHIDRKAAGAKKLGLRLKAEPE